MVQENKLSKLESLLKQQEEIQQQIKKQKAIENEKAKKLDMQRKIIVGGAVIAHATTDNEFAKILAEVLKGAVTEPRNLAVIPDLISNTSTEEITAKDNPEEIPVSTSDSSAEETVEDNKPAMQGDYQP